MCGIVGIMRGSQTETMVDMFEQLLYADVFRGPHSTGVFRTEKDGTATVLKEAVPASVYLNSVDWEDFRGGTGTKKPALLSQVYVGHNRWATMGAINSDNAHPFQCGNITMVHNGTVSKYRLHEHTKFEVDSHAVCNMLNEKGLDETLKVLDGKFTLVWHDANDNTMNFIRNSERPLGMIEFQDGSWAFASEGDMLSWINSRRKSPISVKRMFELPVGMHYKFSLADSKITLLEAVQKTLPKSFPFTSSASSSYQSSTRSSYGGASETHNERSARLLDSWGFNLKEFNATGTPEGTYWALDNVAFTLYSGNYGNGRIDAELWGMDLAIDEAQLENLVIDSKLIREECCPVVIYSISQADWKDKFQDADNLYAQFDGCYETTKNGKQYIQLTLKGLCSELPAGIKAVNEIGFPLKYTSEGVENVDADKSGTGTGTALSVVTGGTGSATGGASSGAAEGEPTGTVIEGEKVNTEKKLKPYPSSPLSEKKYNLSGVGLTIKDLREDNLTCGWCGNAIHELNYEGSDYFIKTLVCHVCAKDIP